MRRRWLVGPATLAIGLLVGWPTVFDALLWLGAAKLRMWKDFLQEYVLARALLAGDDPYVTLGQLVARYVGPPSDLRMFVDQPTPHPPTVGLLMLPLGLLPYEPAAAAWLVLQAAGLVATVRVLLGALGHRPPALVTVGIALGLLRWWPFWRDLTLGQLVIATLLPLALAWAWRRADRPYRAGVALGLSLLVKPVVWPVLPVLLVRREWRMLATASATLGLGWAAALALLGPARLFGYFSEALPTVARVWRDAPENHALATLPVRLGWPRPDALGALLVLLGLGALLAAAWRLRSWEPAFLLAICASLVLSPLSWDWMGGLLLVPLARLVEAGRSRPAALAVAILMVAADHFGDHAGPAWEWELALGVLAVSLCCLDRFPRWSPRRLPLGGPSVAWPAGGVRGQ